jgi:hypothetical protein
MNELLHHQIAKEVLKVVGTGTQADLIADRILALEPIREALALVRAIEMMPEGVVLRAAERFADTSPPKTTGKPLTPAHQSETQRD